MKTIILLLLIILYSCTNKKELDINSKNISIKNNKKFALTKNVSIKNIDSFNLKPDLKINNLELVNPQSIIENLGDLKTIMKEDEGLPYVYFTDKNKKQLLTLISFPGSSYNDIYQIIVEKNKTKNNLPIIQVDNFTTDSNITLGMSKLEIIKLKGDFFIEKKLDKNEILLYSINDYNKSDFLKRYNLPSYFMEFTFFNNKLIKLKFGFDYP
jgi:hypothetical protein